MNFEYDFFALEALYPDLRLEEKKDKKSRHEITGNIDIVDSEDHVWGTFNITIFVSTKYPFLFPDLRLNDNQIPKKYNRHFDKNGFACVCGVIEKKEQEIKGIKICQYIKQYVIPFFANQIHYDAYPELGYLNGDYSHFKKGVIEAFYEEFKTNDRTIVLDKIKRIKSKIGRNKNCFCGSQKKLKYCCNERYHFLKTIIFENKI